MSDGIMLVFGEDGVAREYDDTWDITIHCESEEEQKAVWEKLNNLNREVKNLTDTISRQAAIDAADRADYTGLAVEDVKKVTDEVVKELKKLPSVQPERKSGKWIEIKRSDINPLTGRCGVYVGCSECGAPISTDSQLDYIDESEANYCINCGADMRGEKDV